MVTEVDTQRPGLVRLFTDFSLLPDLLAAPIDSWREYLRMRMANQDHLDGADVPDGDLYERMAVDFEGFVRRIGLYAAGAPTEAGEAIARIGRLPPASRTKSAQQCGRRWPRGSGHITEATTDST